MSKNRGGKKSSRTKTYPQFFWHLLERVPVTRPRMGLLGLSCERKTWDDLIYTLSHDKAWPSHLQRSNHRPKLQCESVTYLDRSQNLFSYPALRSEAHFLLNIRTAGFSETLVPISQITRRHNSKVLNFFLSLRTWNITHVTGLHSSTEQLFIEKHIACIM